LTPSFSIDPFFFLPHLFPRTQMTDVVVLAEHAAQVAPGEENGSAPMLSDQGPLLTEMGAEAGYHGKLSDPADTFLSFQPVHVAMPRTEGAVPEDGPKGIDPPGKFSRFVEMNI
jgi:hypothetical protein